LRYIKRASIQIPIGWRGAVLGGYLPQALWRPYPGYREIPGSSALRRHVLANSSHQCPLLGQIRHQVLMPPCPPMTQSGHSEWDIHRPINLGIYLIFIKVDRGLFG
jgi:hypothetical protein